MKVLVLSDNRKVTKDVEEACKGRQYRVELLSLEKLSLGGEFSGEDCVVVDSKTWQRSASILRYFKVLDRLRQAPMIVLATDRYAGRLKFRETSAATTVLRFPFSPEEFYANVQKLNTVAAEV